ncbi:MAG: hypothetical protein M3X11_10565 [Acidobacteriota bacterium]|nr:hypothetical protein [Acidobacteriota bacterium]
MPDENGGEPTNCVMQRTNELHYKRCFAGMGCSSSVESTEVLPLNV